MSSWIRASAFVLGTALALGAAALAGARLSRTGAPPDLGPAPAFRLADQHGKALDSAQLAGAPWVADFIYASCGEQCPMMTQRMRELSRRMPQARFLSFSVDPDDTPADLARFADRQGASWPFLSGSGSAVERIGSGFHLAVDSGGGAQSIVHSDKLVLVDRRGRIRGYFDPQDPRDADALVAAASRL